MEWDAMLNKSIVHIYKTGTTTIVTLGRQRSVADAALVAKQLGTRLSYVIMPPRHSADRGFQTVLAPAEPPADGHLLVERIDGLTLPSGTAGVILSKDCPILVLKNTHTGRAVLVHAGRPAMASPPECGCCYYTIINPAMRNVLADGGSVSDLRTFIIAGICQNCFTHKGADAEKHLAHFRQFYPEMISGPENTLDLVGVIRQELISYGLDPGHITHDGLCTRCDDRLSSHRRKDTCDNMVLVYSK